MRFNLATSFSCLFVIWSVSHASAATYSIVPITITGASDVAGAAINDAGSIVGTYQQASKKSVGFSMTPKGIKLIAIPEDKSLLFIPSSINNSGLVVGTYYSGISQFGFVWRNGMFMPAFSQGEINANLFPPFIGSGDNLSFNEYLGSGLVAPYAGPVNAPSAINIGNFASVARVNSSLDVSGTYLSFVSRQQVQAVFAAIKGHVLTVIPPGGLSSYGGYINDRRDTAGWYVSQARELRGFIYSKSKFTTFQMPTLATALSVLGLDEVGRVVGSYTDISGIHAFVYAAGKVSVVGAWPAMDRLGVAISPTTDQILICDWSADGSEAKSYLGTCSGPGC